MLAARASRNFSNSKFPKRKEKEKRKNAKGHFSNRNGLMFCNYLCYKQHKAKFETLKLLLYISELLNNLIGNIINSRVYFKAELTHLNNQQSKYLSQLSPP